MAKPLKSSPDPFEVFLQAIRFKNAEHVLIAHERFDSYNLALPMFVVSAFATELFLKCIYHIDGLRPASDHNLGVLFKNLPKPRKKRLKELWQVSNSKRVIDNLNKQVMKDGLKPTANELHLFLEGCGDAFRYFRYLYEGERQALQIINGIPDFFYEAILEIKPQWRLPEAQPTSPVH